MAPRWVARACRFRAQDEGYFRWARSRGCVVHRALQLDHRGLWHAADAIKKNGSELLRTPMHLAVSSTNTADGALGTSDVSQADLHAPSKMALPERWAELSRALAYHSKTQGSPQHVFASHFFEWFVEQQLANLQLCEEEDFDEYAENDGVLINAAIAPPSTFPSPASRVCAEAVHERVALLQKTLPAAVSTMSRVAMAATLAVAIDMPPLPFEIVPLLERCIPQRDLQMMPNARITLRDDNGTPFYVLLSETSIAKGTPIVVAYHADRLPDDAGSWHPVPYDEQLLLRFRTVSKSGTIVAP